MGFTIGLRRAGLRIPAKIFQPPGFGEWIFRAEGPAPLAVYRSTTSQ